MHQPLFSGDFGFDPYSAYRPDFETADEPPRDVLPFVDFAYARHREIWLANYDHPDGIMTATQARHLRHIFEPGRAFSITEFAERIGTSVANASRLVDRLVRNGHVYTERGELDRRTRIIRLTPRGLANYRYVIRRWAMAELRARTHELDARRTGAPHPPADPARLAATEP